MNDITPPQHEEQPRRTEGYQPQLIDCGMDIDTRLTLRILCGVVIAAVIVYVSPAALAPSKESILLGLIALVVAYATYKLGHEWEHPCWSDEDRKRIKGGQVNLLLIIVLQRIYFWITYKQTLSFRQMLLALLVLSVLIYPPFFLGRHISRRKGVNRLPLN